MTVSATITVYRDDEPVEVTVEGRIERVGSYNPHEAGEHIGDWDVVEPRGFELTADESDDAIAALEREI